MEGRGGTRRGEKTQLFAIRAILVTVDVPDQLPGAAGPDHLNRGYRIVRHSKKGSAVAGSPCPDDVRNAR